MNKLRIKKGFIILSIAYIALYLYFFKNHHWLFTESEETFKQLFARTYWLIRTMVHIAVPFFVAAVLYVIVVPALLLHNIKEKGFYFIFLTVSLLFGEFVLRKFHFKPGMLYQSQWFTPVRELQLFHGFSATEEGITNIDADVRNYFITGTSTFPDHLKNQEAYGLIDDYRALQSGEISGELYELYKQIINKDSSARTELEQAILSFIECPINEDGFKSISFKKYAARKPSVMHIGDSFTWGHSTTNKAFGFADLLLARGFPSYNFGISGADPVQYRLIAEKWISQLQPDVVMVHFFMGNDIMKYAREALPHVPQYYSTNAGNLYTHQQGVFLTNADSVYHYIMLMNGIIPEKFIDQLLSKSVLGTQLWRFSFPYNRSEKLAGEWRYYRNKRLEGVQTSAYSLLQMEAIKSICEKYGAKFVLCIIPEQKGFRLIYPADYHDFITDIPLQVPNVFLKDYNTSDGHFNDDGHRSYADFLEKIIE